MEWLIMLLLTVLSTVLSLISQYQKAKKEDFSKTVTTTTIQKSDLDLLEEYGISFKLRKAVNTLINETKSLTAVEYAKKIASVCFGSPSPKIESGDPFGSIDDIPETPFYTYLPVPFNPQSKLFPYIAEGQTYMMGILYDTDVVLPSGYNAGVTQNELGDQVTGKLYALCQLKNASFYSVQSADMIKNLSTQIQYYWNGLINNSDLGGWVALSNSIIEDPFIKIQEAINVLMTAIGYYNKTNKFYVKYKNNFYKLREDYMQRIKGWYLYKGFLLFASDSLETGNAITL